MTQTLESPRSLRRALSSRCAIQLTEFDRVKRENCPVWKSPASRVDCQEVPQPWNELPGP